MTTFLPTLSDLSNPAFEAALQHKLNNKTKPLGSLGRLETLAARIALVLAMKLRCCATRKWWCLRATTA